MPLISVVVPTHNRPEMLSEALASVKAQSFSDYEIIVVSNGESAQMQQRSRTAAMQAGAVWRRLSQPGVSPARNFGAAHAKGEWLAFLDDDDIWVPHKLERQLAAAKQTGADMLACDYVEFYPDGREVERHPRVPEGMSYLSASSRIAWWALPSGSLIRRSAFEAAGGFDPRQWYSEDNELWRRIAWRHRIHQMDEVLLRYRKGCGGKGGRERLHCLYEIRTYFKMRLDTPRHLRSTFPPLEFLIVRLAIVCFPASLTRRLGLKSWSDAGVLLGLVPKFLRQPFHRDRLNRRWAAVRRRWNAFGRQL